MSLRTLWHFAALLLLFRLATPALAADPAAAKAGPGPGFDAAMRGVPPPTHETGFVPLLTGPAASQWKQCGPGRFVLRDGVATGEGGMGLWWFSGRTYTNFVLRGEFLQEQPIADSGVFLRFPDPAQDPWIAVNQGHEMEIGDPTPEDPTWRTGSMYPFCASTRANTRPVGQWNSYQIACIGHHYAVWINGEQVTAWTDPNQRTLRGFIGLQNYNDDKTVRHRNLRIRDLP
ncbi:MAG: DUF1080 domain-containing protein [Verrucomicrobiales bacterium]|nr:DUF1080 domain-containing protein [Verrucomicrobiales bacterium]